MDLLDALHLDRADRQPGEAVLVFPAGEVDANGFLRFLSQVRRLPERVLLVRPRADLVPHVAPGLRTRVHELGPGLHLVDVHHGYEDDPDVPGALALLPALVDAACVRYWVVDDRVVALPLRGMAKWRALLFRALAAASVPPQEWLHLPPERTTVMAAAPRLPAWPARDAEPTPQLPPRERRT